MTQGLAFIKPNRALLKIWVLVPTHFGGSLVEGVSAIGWVFIASLGAGCSRLFRGVSGFHINQLKKS
jgi:hypothetical protein